MLIKAKEHKEIFLVENGKKCWIENWSTYVYMGFGPVEKEVDVIPFEKLRDEYPVGATKVKKTVTTIVEGKKPRDIFYPENPPVPTRKMAVMGTVLTGCEHLAHDLLMTHIIGNGYWWGDYDLVEQLGFKSIINLKPKPVGVPTEDFIKQRMDLWINRKGCGGWWIDNGIRGEEPDAQPTTSDEAKKMLEDRVWFYEVVSKHDPDRVNRPVVEQFNMTEQGVIGGAYRSGWLGQYSEDPMTCDVNLWTCYVHEDTAEKMYKEQLKWYNTFPGKYAKKVQLIPQISLARYWETDNDNSVAVAYRNWKKIMEDKGLALGGLAYYSYLIIKGKGETHDAIREVNKKIQGE